MEDAIAENPAKQKTMVMLDRDTLDAMRHLAIREGYGSRYSPLIERACREFLLRNRRGMRQRSSR